ncbi:MAG: DUF1702 family protein [Chloroflexia bacterium]
MQAATLSAGTLRRRLFGLSPEEATFSKRGFNSADGGARSHLEHIGRTFIRGYNAAHEEANPDALASRLNAIEAEFKGFAFEGAAMALALLDILTPWRRDRWQSFLRGPGYGHKYMLYVGYGWALARLGRRAERPLAKLDPLLGWLAMDGYGFHEGYFHPRRYIVEQALPTRLSGYARRVFDQGLGRSLWFVEGAGPAGIAEAIAAFATARQPDLWSGMGLACTYAGGSNRLAIEALREKAGEHASWMAQGATFAAKARQHAGNPTPHTELACRVLCGTGADEAAQWADSALEDLSYSSPIPAYEVWRQRIRSQAERAIKEVEKEVGTV